MRSQLTLGILLVSLALYAFPVFGTCEVPTKKRILITLNGHNDWAQFATAQATADSALLKDSGTLMHFALNGDQVTGIPRFESGINNQKLSLQRATPSGLKEVANKIRDLVAQEMSAQSITSHSEVEILFMVTNHGVISEGREGTVSGIAGATDEAGNPTMITESDLLSFGQSLPSGVKLKTVFGQCYGFEAQRALLDGVHRSNPESCACGANTADAGSVAYAHPDIPMFEGRVIESYAGGNRSFASAVHDAALNVPTTRGNAAALTSEVLVREWFDKEMQKKGIPDVVSTSSTSFGQLGGSYTNSTNSRLSQLDLETHATEIMNRLSGGSFRQNTPVVIACMSPISFTAIPLPTFSLDFDGQKPERIRLQSNKKEKIDEIFIQPDWLSPNFDWSKSIRQPQKSRSSSFYSINAPAVQNRLAARSQLESYFLEHADRKSVDAFSRLRECEQMEY